MLVEATITVEECRSFLRTITPLVFEIDGPRRTLSVDTPESVEMVADVGLRLRAAARVHWSIGHIHLPIAINVASLVLVPAIEKHGAREALVFRFRIEHVDFKVVPDLIDDAITDTINAALAKNGALRWRFMETLDFHFPLPPRIDTSSRVDLGAKSGRVKITEDAIVFAATFEARAIPRAHAAE
jgi:hypothetical protein